MKQDREAAAVKTPGKRPWKKMEISYLGNAIELIRMPGGGKITAVTGDSGDPRKPSGGG